MIQLAESEMIICRCEEVSYQELLDTAANYKCSSRELKLRTRAGMGYCGGRTCRSLVDQAVKQVGSEKSISLKYQSPIRPVNFADLGGEGK